ncbi:MAG: hypothetical protein ACE5FL_13840 [Myxococcota bacterium]
MEIPAFLRSTGFEGFERSDGSITRVPKATAELDMWTGEPVPDDYNGKAVLDFEGEPLFAELVILRHLQAAGWDGAWIDTYRNRRLVGIDHPIDLPPERQALLDDIYARAGSRAGCFDVFAWSGPKVLFAEAKRSERDQIRPTQTRWLDAALRTGLPIDSFLIVEWNASG